MAGKETSIKENMILKRSITTIINSYINNTEKKACDISLYNNFFSIKVYGKFKENETLSSSLISSLINLTNQVYYITTIDNVKTTKILDFSECESGMFKIKDISTLSSEEKTDSINFTFNKSFYKDTLKDLFKEEVREDLRKYINDIYNDALSYLKIRCFNMVLYHNKKEGNMLNEGNSIFDDEVKIELYKMDNHYKACDVVVNGIKCDVSFYGHLINWNKHPYRQKGYSLKKLAIIIFVHRDNFNFNDKSDIQKVFFNEESKVIDLLEKYKENFRNNKIYFNLDYDKNKMKKVIEKSRCKNCKDAVKYVLDNYIKEE